MTVSKIHIIVKVTNVTVSAISICPDGKFVNKLINEKSVNTLLKFGKNQVNMKNPIVITPATI